MSIDIIALKAANPIADVIGSRIELKRNGRELYACCPFHNDKTPSFTVVPEKGFFHCFGCGAHGDAITFIMQYERVDFKSACAKLERR